MLNESHKRGFKLAAVGCLPLLGLAIWYFGFRPTGQNRQLSIILTNAGYFELAPPSRLFPPGTIATVEKLSNGSLRLHLACAMKSDALAPFWVKSKTFDTQFERNFTSAYSALANAFGVTAAHATGNRVRRVAASLQNMLIVSMSDDNLIKISNDYLRGNCEQAIIWNLRAGAKVCQTSEVLQADVAYRMSFAGGVAADEKFDLAKQAAGSINVDAKVENVDDIRGNNLYFGVKASSHCFQLACADGACERPLIQLRSSRPLPSGSVR